MIPAGFAAVVDTASPGRADEKHRLGRLACLPVAVVDISASASAAAAHARVGVGLGGRQLLLPPQPRHHPVVHHPAREERA